MWAARVLVCALGLLVLMLHVPPTHSFRNFLHDTSFDPCCAYPCQNNGVCLSYPDRSFTCDCADTGYYGPKCDIPTWSTSITEYIMPDQLAIYNFLTSSGNEWFFYILNNCQTLHRLVMGFVYTSRADIVDSPPTYGSEHPYITMDIYFNETQYARALPPVPEHCPTVMGVAGPKDYPDIDEVLEKVIIRKNFLPCPKNTNLLFMYYAQHFTHQFFRTDYDRKPYITLGQGGVDASNIYGLGMHERELLRAHKGGRLKSQIVDGEEYPPYLKDVPGLDRYYPPELNIPEEEKFALGHHIFNLLPGLFAYATIWLREHNRVCGELEKLHPDWDDERLYQTARLIITGEVIQVTIIDYVQHLAQYNVKLTYEPDLVHYTRFQFHNRIHAEFRDLYNWHALVPETYSVNGTVYSTEETMYRITPVLKHGLDNFILSLVKNRAGAIHGGNEPRFLYPVVKLLIHNERIMRFQGFNNYRRRFKLKPYKSFMELTCNEELAAELEKLYKHVDAVEYYVGLFSEGYCNSVTGLSTVDMGGPWSVKGLIANPIGSPRYWKPSTFGGEEGFNIIKTSSLRKLFCGNMKVKDEDCLIQLTVPEGMSVKDEL